MKSRQQEASSTLEAFLDTALESRRLFYVGFTRAKTELHIMFTAGRPSPFVIEVQERLEAEE